MPVNDKITQAEYNNIRTKVIGILGTGSGNSGYGQPITSSAVAEGNRVTVNEYANLRFDIINAWVHQTGSTPTTVTVAAGNTIRFSAVDAPVTTYDTLANTLITNRFDLGAGQSAVAVPTGSPVSRTWTGISGDIWNSSISCTIDVQWPNANAARFFWNSGGQIRITSSRTGGSSTTQNTQWTSILNSAGTQSFGGNNPGTGTSPMNGQNWYRLTNSFQQYYTLSGSSPYGANSYNLLARVTDTADNSSGAAANSQFFVQLLDNYVDPGNSGLGDSPDTVDAVDGTFSIAVSLVYATGVLVPSGTGNFTVAQPTVTFGSILSGALAAPPAAPPIGGPAPPPTFTTAVSPTSRSQTVGYGDSLNNGASFSTTFVLTCTAGSGSGNITTSVNSVVMNVSVSPAFFTLSNGQSQTITMSGTAGPTSLTNPWIFTATSSAGGTFTYTINREPDGVSPA